MSLHDSLSAERGSARRGHNNSTSFNEFRDPTSLIRVSEFSNGAQINDHQESFESSGEVFDFDKEIDEE